MADDELDSLYRLPPNQFTAKRAELAAAAKRRGDAAAARQLSAARKPTTAAWIVNRLVLGDKNVKQRLMDLGDRLRAAHAAMDGTRIRDLSAEQHQLIGELTRAALDGSDVRDPSSTLRDDLTGTLQAAVADPDVRERLGRLTRPEQWSGFGALGEAAPAPPAGRAAKKQASPPRAGAVKGSPRDKGAERREELSAERREKLSAAVTAAERAKARADDVLAERQAERDAARQRRDEAVATLRAAERDLAAADRHYDDAKRAGRAAAASVRDAKAQLRGV